ncbi:DegT/DnrJ/EryC1/StrS family aminotransferase [Geminicoccus roseus]|uniref:DegT/DnrJ/EryC1/StrS family aminotransferase n=1 Tax=Geminicoccus roseus TaxID=404900 RepID=UPI000415DDF6|nr:DegT/DnrJ/EryC1/StrS family aminotransferase [Geminicoccus roseus]
MSIVTPPDRYLPFALPDIGEAEIAEVVDTLRSGWITTGPKARRFERDFGEFLASGDLHAIAVNSATAGLHLALEALQIGPGDEVIVPVHTFTATAEVVNYLGADPVFVDVDPVTLTIRPEAVEAAITPRTRAILPVHYAGLACAMDPLVRIAAKHGLQIVEDAAHALPATSCGGRLIGTLDTAATVFSFYATKTVATGEGGMIVTRSAKIAERARLMRIHGISRDVFDRYSGKADHGGWYYEVVAPGFKYNLPDLAAAIGLHQLARAHAMQQRRAAIAAAYHEAFSCLPVELPAPAPAGELHAWHLYVIRLGRGSRIQRDELILALREAGIGTSVHYVPLHFHPYWRERYGLRPGDFPASTDAYRCMISLPIYSKMADADVERVIGSMRALLG